LNHGIVDYHEYLEEDLAYLVVPSWVLVDHAYHKVDLDQASQVGHTCLEALVEVLAYWEVLVVEDPASHA
jgi:hypothetical protein